ncbi:MAG TPA: thioredoxin-disulfide reductase [Longilinea sp.]|nr:thioredoxin-disulfide reductase [Longilinea sp.]
MDFTLTNPATVAENSDTMEHVKVLVLGAGPAGMAAALYAARAELNPLVLTGNEVGGQASLTFAIENYPGFPDGVGGGELGDLFKKQAERFGARFEYDLASEVDLTARPFRVKTYSQEYLADSLIIATGASPNHLGIAREAELTGRGISYCATCDGWFFKEKKVVVVGGGDSAIEEAIFLTRYAKSVTLIHRRDSFRAGAILQRRAKDNPKIDFILDSVVTEVLGEEKVQAVKIKNLKSGTVSTLETDGVFIFIGHTPNTEMFKGQLEMEENGIIVTDALMHTSVPGVFAAGEVMDRAYRQVVTSAGMGAAAAIEATRFLEREEVH